MNDTDWHNLGALTNRICIAIVVGCALIAYAIAS